MAEWMLNNITTFSKEYLKTHPEIDYFIYGHLHIVRDLPLEDSARILVLGEWISQFSYAVWDGSDLKMLRYESNKC
jgi:UDP-2,3-diacylglucosamine hydrolase